MVFLSILGKRMKNTDAGVTAFSKYTLSSQFLTLYVKYFKQYSTIFKDLCDWMFVDTYSMSKPKLNTWSEHQNSVTFSPRSAAYSTNASQVWTVLVLWFWLLFIWPLISNANGQAKELPTYKDNDFINDGQKIYIDGENKKMFLEKLRKDVEVWVCTKTAEIPPSVSPLSVRNDTLYIPPPFLSPSYLLPSPSVPGPAEAHGLQSAGGDPRCGASRAGRRGERGQWGRGGGREWRRGHWDAPRQSQQHPGQHQASVAWRVWSRHWRLCHQKPWRWVAKCMV